MALRPRRAGAHAGASSRWICPAAAAATSRPARATTPRAGATSSSSSSTRSASAAAASSATRWAATCACAPRSPTAGAFSRLVEHPLARRPRLALSRARPRSSTPGMRAMLSWWVRRAPQRWAHANVHYFDESPEVARGGRRIRRSARRRRRRARVHQLPRRHLRPARHRRLRRRARRAPRTPTSRSRCRCCSSTRARIRWSRRRLASASTRSPRRAAGLARRHSHFAHVDTPARGPTRARARSCDAQRSRAWLHPMSMSVESRRNPRRLAAGSRRFRRPRLGTLLRAIERAVTTEHERCARSRRLVRPGNARPGRGRGAHVRRGRPANLAATLVQEGACSRWRRRCSAGAPSTRAPLRRPFAGAPPPSRPGGSCRCSSSARRSGRFRGSFDYRSAAGRRSRAPASRAPTASCASACRFAPRDAGAGRAARRLVADALQVHRRAASDRDGELHRGAPVARVAAAGGAVASSRAHGGAARWLLRRAARAVARRPRVALNHQTFAILR